MNKAESLCFLLNKIDRENQSVLRHIELDKENWTKLRNSDINKIVTRLKKLGYKYVTVDLEGYVPAGIRERARSLRHRRIRPDNTLRWRT